MRRTARPRKVDPMMTDEKQNDRPEDEIVDEMPEPGGAPCGDVFFTPGTTHVTDADDDVIGGGQKD
jgi:hypothetical protein